MRIRGVAALAIGLSISAQAVASDWWFVSVGGAKPKRSITLMDKETLRVMPGGKVRAWAWRYFEDQSDNVATAKTMYEFDCNDQTSRTVNSILYGRTDDLIKSKSFTIYESPHEPIAPGTVGADELQFVCSNGKDSFDIGEVDSLRVKGPLMLKMADTPPNPIGAPPPLSSGKIRPRS